MNKRFRLVIKQFHLILSLCAISKIVDAQGVYLGGKIGLSPKTAHKYVPGNQSNLAGGRIFVSFDELEAGLDFELGHNQVKGIVRGVDESHTIKYPNHSVYTIAFYNATQFFGNYKIINSRSFDFYAGVSAGVDLGLSRNVVLINEDANEKPVSRRDFDGGGGLCVGFQAGWRYKFTRIFSAQVEIGARAPFLNDGGVAYIPIYFPVSIGLNARLFRI